MAGVDPTPPAYWIAGIDWKTIAASVFGSGGILAMAWPAVKAWREGRTARIESEAKRAESAQERLDRQSAENYARVQADRDYAYERIERMEAARLALEIDRNNGWNKGRAMEDEAHYQRHAAVNAVQSWRSLRSLLASMAEGSEGRERAKALLGQVVEPITPHEVPELSEIKGKLPP